MARDAKKIGTDMTRAFRAVLALERDLLRAYAEGDRERAKVVVADLRRAVERSERGVRDFLKAVRLPPIGNPGSRDGEKASEES
jgi:hypothetical protein